ncbi:hypothetical protein D3C81_1951120 [compost metagenome]
MERGRLGLPDRHHLLVVEIDVMRATGAKVTLVTADIDRRRALSRLLQVLRQVDPLGRDRLGLCLRHWERGASGQREKSGCKGQRYDVLHPFPQIVFPELT